jgi:hypothetical protein
VHTSHEELHHHDTLQAQGCDGCTACSTHSTMSLALGGHARQDDNSCPTVSDLCSIKEPRRENRTDLTSCIGVLHTTHGKIHHHDTLIHISSKHVMGALQHTHSIQSTNRLALAKHKTTTHVILWMIYRSINELQQIEKEMRRLMWLCHSSCHTRRPQIQRTLSPKHS